MTRPGRAHTRTARTVGSVQNNIFFKKGTLQLPRDASASSVRRTTATVPGNIRVRYQRTTGYLTLLPVIDDLRCDVGSSDFRARSRCDGSEKSDERSKKNQKKNCQNPALLFFFFFFPPLSRCLPSSAAEWDERWWHERRRRLRWRRSVIMGTHTLSLRKRWCHRPHRDATRARGGVSELLVRSCTRLHHLILHWHTARQKNNQKKTKHSVSPCFYAFLQLKKKNISSLFYHACLT